MELIYARWLSRCTRPALAVLAATFAAYVTGLLEPLISLERLPQVWGLALEPFLAATGAPTGWDWLGAAGRGDYANLVGVTRLACVTLVCYLRLLAALLGQREHALAWLTALQVAVLAAAASGLLTGAH